MIVNVRTIATVQNGIVTEKVSLARVSEAEWIDEWLHIIWVGDRPYVAICEDCGHVISNQDQVDLSYIRFRTVLCKECFKKAKRR